MKYTERTILLKILAEYRSEK